MDNQLTEAIYNFLGDKSGDFTGDDFFSLISIITLLKIIDLKEQNPVSLSGNNKVNKNTGNNDTLMQLINQLQQGQEKENNMQALLPLLLNTLGRGNLDNLLNNFNSSTSEEDGNKDLANQKSEKEELKTENREKKK